jgi:hypothetical protein
MKKNSSVVIKLDYEGSWAEFSKRTKSYAFTCEMHTNERYCLFTTNHTIAVKLAILGMTPNKWYSMNNRLVKLLNIEAINDN